MDRPVVAVVLAGGTGTRLYPASRAARPKQFRAFGGDRTLFERAVDRVAFADETVVLTGDAHADRVRDLAPDAAVLVEPGPKDTGPALAYAARRLRERYPDAVLLCVPSDHHVDGDFEAAARRACRAAADGSALVTMGVEPTRPATEYGYIRPGDEATGLPDGAVPVERFEEKPSRERARRFVDEGCLWNAGVFAWTPDALLSACEGTPLDPLATADDPEAGFAAVDPASVDYAVLERADRVRVVPVSFGWDDLGSWDALERVLDRDAAGNAVLGDALTVEAADNVVATDGHVSLVGVEDLVVAAFDDRVLVVPKDDAQRVRDVVSELREDGLF
jgi:mannose-1-phosphate guanylyltransferase